jgi:sterol-4alpha-carboxylate 3-dehydrogenase (decarboxylating)
VVSRSAANSKNHVNGATYHSGDLTDHDSIKQLLLKIKPTVIIHAASPSAVLGTPKEFERLMIQGTKNLLKLAKESKDVRHSSTPHHLLLLKSLSISTSLKTVF